MRRGLEGPTPTRGPPFYTAPGTKEGPASPSSTGTLEVVHLTVQWEPLRPEWGREPPQVPQDQWGGGGVGGGQGFFLLEAPPEPPEEGWMWYPVTQ